MYNLDLRLNVKLSGESFYKKLLQNSELESSKPNEILENLELKRGNNSIEVEVGRDFFKLWINGEKFKEAVKVDPQRILQYSHISLIQTGTCASFDLVKSFTEFRIGE